MAGGMISLEWRLFNALLLFVASWLDVGLVIVNRFILTSKSLTLPPAMSMGDEMMLTR